MSILIPGMEMPKNCFHCKFENFYVCDITDQDVPGYQFDERPDDCPIIELQPHGDMIDRSKLGLTDFEIVMCDGNFKQALEMLLKKIGDAHTIIEAEGSGT